jgi:hypothetical protein
MSAVSIASKPFRNVAELAPLYANAGDAWATVPVRITHCLNPFAAEPNSSHDRAQRVTLKSMRSARQFANLSDPELSVRHVAVVLSCDARLDNGFDEVLHLPRTIQDVADLRPKRHLPLIQDILDAPALPDDDVLVYTNIDIAIAPNFYLFLAELFRLGLDALVINRRTVSDSYPGPEALTLMSAEVGTPHPGYDCFAFRAGLRRQFYPWNSCIGIGGVMLPLVHNLLASAKAPSVLLDAHITFHLGDDKTWTDPAFAAYAAFNQAEIVRVFEQNCAHPERGAKLLSALKSDPSGRLPRRLRSAMNMGRRPLLSVRQRVLKRLRGFTAG